MRWSSTDLLCLSAAFYGVLFLRGVLVLVDTPDKGVPVMVGPCLGVLVGLIFVPSTAALSVLPPKTASVVPALAFGGVSVDKPAHGEVSDPHPPFLRTVRYAPHRSGRAISPRFPRPP